ncbi:hypothetical protein SDC9_168963 [bioreactor metagenome]|uniref:Uncharacterized protein n=1 Tax=bioreactor metagenome TaxID=1076179 RepID=A0A645GCJ4_9ZZZZ
MRFYHQLAETNAIAFIQQFYGFEDARHLGNHMLGAAVNGVAHLASHRFQIIQAGVSQRFDGRPALLQDAYRFITLFMTGVVF